MPDQSQENTTAPSLLQPSSGISKATPPPQLQFGHNKRALFLGGALVLVMLVLVAATFYSLRTGTSSTPSPTPAPATSSSSNDQTLDQGLTAVDSSMGGLDQEVGGIDGGLNDRSADLTY